MKTERIVFPDLYGMVLNISYAEIDSKSSLNSFDSHIHNECEIYVNLSGDVSFVVENSIYPVTPGSIIITRPGEYHRCVYHSNAIHKHFWILFSADSGKELFNSFYGRSAGADNMRILSGSRLTELIELCRKLISSPTNGAEQLYRFFKLIHLIDMAEVTQNPTDSDSPCMDLALDFIHKNLSESICVKDIAKAAFVSVNTLERHFLRKLQMSPSAYLKKRRLANAAALLQNGESVTYACQQSGFIDCSKFIILFKKHYGMTPLKYKKEHQKNK